MCIRDRAQHLGWNSGRKSQDFLFSPEKVIAGLRHISVLGQIWDYLSLWGNFASTAMGIYFIGRFMWWTYGCMFAMVWPVRTETALDRLQKGLAHTKEKKNRSRRLSDSDSYGSNQSVNSLRTKKKRRWYPWRQKTKDSPSYNSTLELGTRPSAPRYTSRPSGMRIPPPGIEFGSYHDPKDYQEGLTWNKLEKKELSQSTETTATEDKQHSLLSNIGHLETSLAGFFAANPTLASACENTFDNIKHLRSVLLSKGLSPQELAEINSKLETEKETLRNISRGVLPEDVC